MYAGQLVGFSNIENKYEFPPPVDNQMYFGTCLLVSYTLHNGIKKYTPLNIDIWNSIYEKLFGGFEDLSKTALSDEFEPDELANVPKHKLTKEGYLKDGFVVDNKSINHNYDDDYSGETDDHASECGSEWSDMPDEDKKPKKNKHLKKQSSVIKHTNTPQQPTPTPQPIMVEELTHEPYIK